MKTINISYIRDKDQYRFHEAGVDIKRYLFLYTDHNYLTHALGLENMSIKDREALFLMLGRESDTDHYSLQFDTE